jgi:hypothetical protein
MVALVIFIAVLMSAALEYSKRIQQKLNVAFTEIGNNFVYLRGLHFPVSFLYMYQI